jgi:hypothetical protein
VTLAQHQQRDMFPDKRELQRAVDVLTARFVWFYPKLTHTLGSPKAALLMCALLNVARQPNDSYGWVFKTRDQWGLETGLGRRELETARAELTRLGFIQETLTGTPRRLYMRADLIQLGIALAAASGVNKFREWDWNNSALMLQLLGKPFGFYQQATKACESAQAAIFLSFLIYLQRGALNNASATAEWFTMPADRAQSLLGLTYRMQRTARQKLQQAGLIDQRRASSFNHETEFRVRFGALLDLIAFKAKAPSQSLDRGGIANVDNSPSVDNLGSDEYLCFRKPNFGALKTTKTPYEDDINALSDMTKTPYEDDINALSDMTKTPSKQVHFVRSYIKTNKNKYPPYPPTTKTPYGLEVERDESGSSGRFDKNARTPLPEDEQGIDLFAIPDLLKTQTAQALAGLDRATAQLVADEFAGRMASKSMDALNMPLRYLQALVASVKNGTFRLELGAQEAQRRQSRERSHQAPPKAVDDMPARPEVVAKGKAELQRLRALMRATRSQSANTRQPTGFAQAGTQALGDQNLSEVGFGVKGGCGPATPPQSANTRREEACQKLF